MILAHHVGRDLDEIQRDTERDNFMGGEDAATYGIIDKVISQREV